MKAAALQTLEKEPSRWLTKPVCDLVGILSMRATAAEGWPQLLPWMFNAVRGSNELLRLHALQLFASTAESIFDAVKPYMGTLHTVIKVRGAACFFPFVRFCSPKYADKLESISLSRKKYMTWELSPQTGES